MLNIFPTFTHQHSGVRKATGERGMVVSRSTYPSSGKYAGHWLGDNASTWSSLKESIIGQLGSFYIHNVYLVL